MGTPSSNGWGLAIPQKGPTRDMNPLCELSGRRGMNAVQHLASEIILSHAG